MQDEPTYKAKPRGAERKRGLEDDRHLAMAQKATLLSISRTTRLPERCLMRKHSTRFDVGYDWATQLALKRSHQCYVVQSLSRCGDLVGQQERQAAVGQSPTHKCPPDVHAMHAMLRMGSTLA